MIEFPSQDSASPRIYLSRGKDDDRRDEGSRWNVIPSNVVYLGQRLSGLIASWPESPMLCVTMQTSYAAQPCLFRVTDALCARALWRKFDNSRSIPWNSMIAMVEKASSSIPWFLIHRLRAKSILSILTPTTSNFSTVELKIEMSKNFYASPIMKNFRSLFCNLHLFPSIVVFRRSVRLME